MNAEQKAHVLAQLGMAMNNLMHVMREIAHVSDATLISNSFRLKVARKHLRTTMEHAEIAQYAIDELLKGKP
mgnify:CR=1 FL=1